MRKVWIATAHRSERGLLNPVIRRAKKHPKLEVTVYEVDPNKPVSKIAEDFEKRLEFEKPDIIVIPCDRLEMLPIAIIAYYNNIVIAHFHAGDLGDGVHGEAARFAISRFAHIMFCNSLESVMNLWKVGEERWRIFHVGSTAFDDVELDDSIVPNQPFDLVLLHPDTVSKEGTRRDVKRVFKILDKYTIVLYPDRGLYYEEIVEEIQKHRNDPDVKIIKELPRPQFLALLKNCERFIGNSSAIQYEAPFFGTKTVHIGERNRYRPKIEVKLGGSDKICEVLANIEINEKLLRKGWKVKGVADEICMELS